MTDREEQRLKNLQDKKTKEKKEKAKADRKFADECKRRWSLTPTEIERRINIGEAVEQHAGCEITNFEAFTSYLEQYSRAIARTQEP